MSKGSIFWGKSKGKLGEMVLSVLKGQQVQRAYNSRPANPRTEKQMLQRMRFASAGKFFKHSQQALFKLAFMNKTQLESNFNAFMRNNLKEGIAIYPTREELDNPFFPMVAPWRLSKGTLNTIGMDSVLLEDDEYIIGSTTISCSDPGSCHDWQEFLAENPSLRVGDIITFATLVSQATITSGAITPANAQPFWKINSITIGADLRGATLDTYLSYNNMGNSYNNTLEHYFNIVEVPGVSNPSRDNIIIGSCCILSREVNGKLHVSSEHLHLNLIGKIIYATLSDEGKRALPSWDAEPDAILEGSEAKNSQADVFYGLITRPWDIGADNATDLVMNLNPKLVEGDKVVLKVSANGTTPKTLYYTWEPSMRIVNIGELFGPNQWALQLLLTREGIYAWNQMEKTVRSVTVDSISINGKEVIDPRK